MVVPYLSYFKLEEEPFNITSNPRFFFLSLINSIALDKTEFTVDAKKGLAIVFGDTGTGKSTLARLLHQKFLGVDPAPRTPEHCEDSESSERKEFWVPGAKPRYSKEFKKEAVQVIRSSGRSIPQS